MQWLKSKFINKVEVAKFIGMNYKSFMAKLNSYDYKRSFNNEEISNIKKAKEHIINEELKK